MSEILFLTHRVPWPPNRGDKIRSHHFLRKLMEFTPVHLTCFADDAAEAAEHSYIKAALASCQIVERTKPKWRAGLEALASEMPISLASFGSDSITRYIRNTLKKNTIDCIFIFSGQMAQYIPSDFQGRVIMDFADVDSAKFESYGEDGFGPMAWINRREGRLLREFEKQVGERADHSLFVSEAEAHLFQTRSGLGADRIKAVGNGIDIEFYDPDKAVPVERGNKGPLIVFTGQMDYRPNVQAVDSFASDAMPKILEQHPDARFAIVGRAPTADVLKLDGQNGTQIIGAVDDIRSWLIAADIIVAPLRIARGIQNKVLEAMAMAKPVVASAAAAEGIDAVDGQHFLVAKDVANEARLVCELLSQPEKAKALGAKAKAFIHAHYTWEQQLSGLPALCGLNEPMMVEAAE